MRACLLRRLCPWADWIANTHQDFIHLIQEALYFFTVLFLVDTQLGKRSILAFVLASVIIALSLFRLIHYLSILVLLPRGLALLSPESKTKIIVAYDNHADDRVDQILAEELKLRSSKQVTQRIFRVTREVLRRKYLRVE